MHSAIGHMNAKIARQESIGVDIRRLDHTGPLVDFRIEEPAERLRTRRINDGS
jgi:hypothetical protein